MVVGHDVERQNVEKRKIRKRKKIRPSELDPAIFWIEDPSLTG